MPPLRHVNQLETELAKDAISLALDDLKEKYTGALLSDHALKVPPFINTSATLPCMNLLSTKFCIVPVKG